MMSEETFELIEKYLQGELSEIDRQSFEHRMKNNPAFFEQVKIHQASFDLVIDTGVLQVKEKLNRIHQIETGKERVWKWKIYLSGFLSLLLIVGGGYYYWIDKEKKSEEVVVATYNKSSLDSLHVTTMDKNRMSNAGSNNIQKINKKENTHNNVRKDEVIIPLTISSIRDSMLPAKENVLRTSSNEPSDHIKPVSGNQTLHKVDCAVVKISGTVDSKASCAHEATGVIFINLGTVKGGTKPYRYSISNDEEYGVTAQYDHLSPGLYTLKVKDHNGCGGILTTVTIESSDCPREYAFAPSRGEEWTVPVEKILSGELKITDRKGNIVYSSPFSNGISSPWTGLDNHGQSLPMGVYLFLITYSNGHTQQGYVTILQ